MLQVKIFEDIYTFRLERKINDWLKRNPYYFIKQVSYAGKGTNWSALALYEEVKND